MRTHTSKRAVRLASALVAAGLTLTAAPHALAADASTDAMKLTGKQADALAERMRVDVYGDDVPTEGADATDRSVDGAGTAGPSRSSGSTASSDEDAPVITRTSDLEGVRGVGATVPAADGGYFTVHSLGNVQLHRADGTTVWARTNTSYYEDWQVEPVRPWQSEPYPAHILTGYNAVSPLSPYSDQGYDTSDLTGDGTPDFVFSASVGDYPYRPFTSPGSSLPTGTFVTVLDGRTGETAWSKLYSYAALVKVVDGTLLVADSPRLNQNSAATETLTLTGIRFAADRDGKLTPSSTWTYDTEETVSAGWGALEDLGNGRVAASWNRFKSSDAAAHGHTLVLDTTDGSLVWQADNALYSRQLHLDASRDRLIALEQADVTDAVRYDIASYDLSTGERTTLDSRTNAVPTAMTVGDAARGGGDEYVVAESTLDSSQFVNAATIRVLDGADGSTAKWTHTTKRSAGNTRDGANVWRLDVADGSLVASSQDDRDLDAAENPGYTRYGALTVFNAKGAVKWEEKGVSASPMVHQVYRAGGGEFVRVIDLSQNIRTFKLGTGKAKNLTPLQGDLNYGQAVDLNGDRKKDVVAGGTSHGVWAWSGPSLVKGGEPKKLWETSVAGEVHDVQTGDVNGDGRPEIVVAADTATAVLDGATGHVLTTIEAGGGEFVRSVTVADVNGDGKDEILVPTDALRVYDARGRELWTYSAPESAGDVVFSDTAVGDGQVYTQYAGLGAFQLSEAAVNGVALDGRTGAVKWTADPQAPDAAADGRLRGAVLRKGVFASPKIPFADGHAVVNTWIAWADPTTEASTDAATPHVVVEIRDGRDGKVLHRTLGGSPWSYDNFLIDGQDDPLYLLSFGTFTGISADGSETFTTLTGPLRGAEFITGPGGRKLVAGGMDGGIGVWATKVLTSPEPFQAALSSVGIGGGRNYIAADLDGNGVDDLVSLNFDKSGYDRMAQQLGSRVFSPDNAIHRMATFTLS
ncbi:FG-GAP repeat domain-containing protein [Streptomyces sp. NPDC057340]|uniref:FG-GAP repeat domain-containing protein n=1 Tax=Streptomyces sp. NPDC057340 TaxID=3346103 RepID=UPI003634632B